MIQFYAPDIAFQNALTESESAHCVRVLRKKSGDLINVVDGIGTRYLCRIEDAHPKHTTFSIVSQEKVSFHRPYKLTIAVAPPKNSERLEWMVEKAVEIGLDKIVLLQCERSERKVMRSDRLIKVMISAMKQSLSAELPEIVEMQDFQSFVSQSDSRSQKFFGYCSDSLPRKEFVKECQPGGEVVVMIGPEGDFTPGEVKSAIANGFIPVTFGEKRLRTETAGVFTVCAVDVINKLL